MYYLLFSIHSKKQKKNITERKRILTGIFTFFIVADDLFILYIVCICFFSLSIKGQRAADPPQLEEAFRSGLGNQSEKGEPARFNGFV